MRIFIEPTETLLFRKGRSFEAGDGNFAETMFPPTPETIQGALRAAIAAQSHPKETLSEAFKDDELVKLIGNRDSYGRFRITGFTLGQRNNEGRIDRLFSPPANLLQDKQGITQLLPQKNDGISSNFPTELDPHSLRYLLPSRKFDDKPRSPDGWLTETGLGKLLREQKHPEKEDFIANGKIFTYESRVGIGMENSTKTTKEGLLYTTQMVRMQPGYGFVVDIRLSIDAGSAAKSEKEIKLVDDTETLATLGNYLDNSWLTLGGERRTAYVEVLKDPQVQKEQKERPQIEQARNGNMLYLATPTYFSKGWLPEQWPNNATLVSAALNHYQPIGGWKLEPGHYGGASKDMRRCVPAGSIYFFKDKIDFPQPLIQNVQDNYGWQIGYGISYAGEYKS